jgi:hypothetical protein
MVEVMSEAGCLVVVGEPAPSVTVSSDAVSSDVAFADVVVVAFVDVGSAVTVAV